MHLDPRHGGQNLADRDGPFGLGINQDATKIGTLATAPAVFLLNEFPDAHGLYPQLTITGVPEGLGAKLTFLAFTSRRSAN
jgi:hypothetical protein